MVKKTSSGETSWKVLDEKGFDDLMVEIKHKEEARATKSVTAKKKRLKDKILNSSPEQIKEIIDIATEAAIKKNKNWQEKDKISKMSQGEIEAKICNNTEFVKVGDIRAERDDEMRKKENSSLFTQASEDTKKHRIFRTPEIEDEILERISKGESVNKICEDKHLPNQSTFYDWIAKDEEFAKNYVRAREAYADYIAEEIIEISDNATNDWMEQNGQESVGWQLNGEHVQRSRLRIDTRKWIASKLKPKKYGDSLNIKGEIETKPATTSISQFSRDDILTGIKHGIFALDLEGLEKVNAMLEIELHKKRSENAKIINQTSQTCS